MNNDEKNKLMSQLKKNYMQLTESVIKFGVNIHELELQHRHEFKIIPEVDTSVMKRCLCTLLAAIFISLYILLVFRLDDLWYTILDSPCVIPNNYLIWEATRPISDCKFCRGISAPLILPNVTQEEFKIYAYSSRPMIIKRAVEHWPAMQYFNFSMLKELYMNIDGALDDKDGPCQFLHFKSEFISLREVFEMPEIQSEMKDGSPPWYVGWSNCNPKVLSKLRLHYPRPHFLPSEAEMPNAEYLFIGYEQGAIMHLDYVPRLMWQAQLRGRKHWSLAPTPECDHVCSSMEFSVDPGDAVLVDTRIWYHGTRIQDGDFSVTIQSEYG